MGLQRVRPDLVTEQPRAKGRDPSMGPLPEVANANQTKPGSMWQSRNVIIELGLKKGELCPKNTLFPKGGEKGNFQGIGGRAQAKGQRFSGAAGARTVFQASLHTARIVPKRIQNPTLGDRSMVVSRSNLQTPPKPYMCRQFCGQVRAGSRITACLFKNTCKTYLSNNRWF